MLNSALEEAERTNHWEERQVDQEAEYDLKEAKRKEAEKAEHFSESWIMRIMNRMKLSTQI